MVQLHSVTQLAANQKQGFKRLGFYLPRPTSFSIVIKTAPQSRHCYPGTFTKPLQLERTRDTSLSAGSRVMMNSSTLFFFVMIFIILSDTTFALDSEACEACVSEQGCGYCVVDGVTSCVCNAFDFEKGYQCNGGKSSFKTNVSLGCTKAGIVILFTIPLVILLLLCGCGWGCCFVCRRNPHKMQYPEAQAVQLSAPTTRAQSYRDTNEMVLVDQWSGPVDTPVRLVGNKLLEISPEQAHEEHTRIEKALGLENQVV